jgi:hypothetical protein
MHQEELGLLKKEVINIYARLDAVQKELVDSLLRRMPKVPGFPRFTGTLADAKHFQAKQWITIAKLLPFVVKGILHPIIL